MNIQKEIVEKYGKRIKEIYNEEYDDTVVRISNMVKEFRSLYGEGDYSIYTVAGRTEICGNHTDHNYGMVACASINLDVIAIVKKTDDMLIRVKSEGYPEFTCDVRKEDVDEKLFGDSESIARGVCMGLKNRGYKYGGFYAYTQSKILKGSGLSSSAAFEDLIGTIENYIYNEGKIDVITLSQISQYAENVYFGKPCGLMDQIACSLGGFAHIDFENKNEPKVNKYDFSPEDHKYSLYIVDTGGSHVNLTDDYASVPNEMKSVAKLFGKEVLRGLKEEDLIEKAIEIRTKCGDRAFLRSLHFIRENQRVEKLITYLKNDDIDGFLSIISESGRSSNELLQNLYSVKSPNEQGIPLACALTETILKGKGAWRVHGGGFAGTMQAFVPFEKEQEFKKVMQKVFGEKSVTKLKIRKYGQAKIGWKYIHLLQVQKEIHF